MKCPKCDSKSIVGCPGGTCLVPIKSIKYICEDCLYEF